MLRSFALSFAVVTLRLWLPLAAWLGLDPVESYRLIAWFCWLPNLLLVELHLRRRVPPRLSF